MTKPKKPAVSLQPPPPPVETLPKVPPVPKRPMDAEKKTRVQKPPRRTVRHVGQGRIPPYVPSDGHRVLVQLAVASGMSQDAACLAIGISKTTLLKHYRDEWDSGAEVANMKIAGALYSLATQTQDRKAALTACIWWTKARMGWKGDTAQMSATATASVIGAANAATRNGDGSAKSPLVVTLKIGERGDDEDAA